MPALIASLATLAVAGVSYVSYVVGYKSGQKDGKTAKK